MEVFLCLRIELLLDLIILRGDSMKQYLEVKIEVSDTHVLSPKDFYEQLLRKDLTGQYYYMKDLERLTGRLRTWLNQNFLNRPDVLKRIKPFTMFPEGKGSDWIFQATALTQFLEDEFLEILRR